MIHINAKHFTRASGLVSLLVGIHPIFLPASWIPLVFAKKPDAIQDEPAPQTELVLRAFGTTTSALGALTLMESEMPGKNFVALKSCHDLLMAALVAWLTMRNTKQQQDSGVAEKIAKSAMFTTLVLGVAGLLAARKIPN